MLHCVLATQSLISFITMYLTPFPLVLLPWSPFHPLVTIILLTVSSFCLLLCFITTYEWNHTVFVTFLLTYFTEHDTIHVVSNGNISFVLNNSFCLRVTSSCFWSLKVLLGRELMWVRGSGCCKTWSLLRLLGYATLAPALHFKVSSIPNLELETYVFSICLVTASPRKS